MWVRGLKPTFVLFAVHKNAVAPRVGAWIETVSGKTNKLTRIVAPRVGAWIETDYKFYIINKMSRRTPCGCVD